VEHFDKELQDLINRGKVARLSDLRRGQRYLPDEELNPDKLDNLLMALDEKGIELVDRRRRRIRTRISRGSHGRRTRAGSSRKTRCR
jgi:RNA polymerase primary sigma factor